MSVPLRIFGEQAKAQTRASQDGSGLDVLRSQVVLRSQDGLRSHDGIRSQDGHSLRSTAASISDSLFEPSNRPSARKAPRNTLFRLFESSSASPRSKGVLTRTQGLDFSARPPTKHGPASVFAQSKSFQTTRGIENISSDKPRSDKPRSEKPRSEKSHPPKHILEHSGHVKDTGKCHESARREYDKWDGRASQGFASDDTLDDLADLRTLNGTTKTAARQSCGFIITESHTESAPERRLPRAAGSRCTQRPSTNRSAPNRSVPNRTSIDPCSIESHLPWHERADLHKRIAALLYGFKVCHPIEVRRLLREKSLKDLSPCPYFDLFLADVSEAISLPELWRAESAAASLLSDTSPLSSGLFDSAFFGPGNTEENKAIDGTHTSEASADDCFVSRVVREVISRSDGLLRTPAGRLWHFLAREDGFLEDQARIVKRCRRANDAIGAHFLTDLFPEEIAPKSLTNTKASPDLRKALRLLSWSQRACSRPKSLEDLALGRNHSTEDSWHFVAEVARLQRAGSACSDCRELSANDTSALDIPVPDVEASQVLEGRRQKLIKSLLACNPVKVRQIGIQEARRRAEIIHDRWMVFWPRTVVKAAVELTMDGQFSSSMNMYVPAGLAAVAASHLALCAVSDYQWSLGLMYAEHVLDLLGDESAPSWKLQPWDFRPMMLKAGVQSGRLGSTAASVFDSSDTDFSIGEGAIVIGAACACAIRGSNHRFWREKLLELTAPRDYLVLKACLWYREQSYEDAIDLMSVALLSPSSHPDPTIRDSDIHFSAVRESSSFDQAAAKTLPQTRFHSRTQMASRSMSLALAMNISDEYFDIPTTDAPQSLAERARIAELWAKFCLEALEVTEDEAYVEKAVVASDVAIKLFLEAPNGTNRNKSVSDLSRAVAPLQALLGRWRPCLKAIGRASAPLPLSHRYLEVVAKFCLGDFREATSLAYTLLKDTDMTSTSIRCRILDLLGQIHFQESDIGKAHTAFQEVLTLDPCHLRAAVFLASIELRRSGITKQAVDALHEVLDTLQRLEFEGKRVIVETKRPDGAKSNNQKQAESVISHDWWPMDSVVRFNDIGGVKEWCVFTMSLCLFKLARNSRELDAALDLIKNSKNEGASVIRCARFLRKESFIEALDFFAATPVSNTDLNSLSDHSSTISQSWAQILTTWSRNDIRDQLSILKAVASERILDKERSRRLCTQILAQTTSPTSRAVASILLSMATGRDSMFEPIKWSPFALTLKAYLGEVAGKELAFSAAGESKLHPSSRVFDYRVSGDEASGDRRRSFQSCQRGHMARSMHNMGGSLQLSRAFHRAHSLRVSPRQCSVEELSTDRDLLWLDEVAINGNFSLWRCLSIARRLPPSPVSGNFLSGLLGNMPEADRIFLRQVLRSDMIVGTEAARGPDPVGWILNEIYEASQSYEPLGDFITFAKKALAKAERGGFRGLRKGSSFGRMSSRSRPEDEEESISKIAWEAKVQRIGRLFVHPDDASLLVSLLISYTLTIWLPPQALMPHTMSLPADPMTTQSVKQSLSRTSRPAGLRPTKHHLESVGSRREGGGRKRESENVRRKGDTAARTNCAFPSDYDNVPRRELDHEGGKKAVKKPKSESSRLNKSGNRREARNDVRSETTLEDRLVCDLFNVPLEMPMRMLIHPRELEQLHPLDDGAFGSVYLGILRRPGQREELVAIKLMKPHGGKREVLKAFINECNNLTQLSHPNLVKFLGASFNGDLISLVTELCPHGSVSEALHKDPARVLKVLAKDASRALKFQLTQNDEKIPLKLRYKWIKDITEGLHYLHTRAPTIIHRDLKPMNVVLDNNLNAKICDFGLTVSMTDAASESGVFVTGPARGGCGSPRYMAPETFSLNGKITEKVDIWALAALTTEILTGVVPFPNLQDVMSVRKAVIEERKHPRIPKGLPEELNTLLLRCFSYKAANRPSTEEFRRVLGSACGC